MTSWHAERFAATEEVESLSRSPVFWQRLAHVCASPVQPSVFYSRAMVATHKCYGYFHRKSLRPLEHLPWSLLQQKHGGKLEAPFPPPEMHLLRPRTLLSFLFMSCFSNFLMRPSSLVSRNNGRTMWQKDRIASAAFPPFV